MGLFGLEALFALPVAIVSSLFLDRKLHENQSGLQPYKWGYFQGFMGVLTNGWLALYSFFTAGEHYGATTNEVLLLTLFFLLMTFIFAGFIFRNRWWCLVAVIAQLNPVTWFINAIYLKNRWAELAGVDFCDQLRGGNEVPSNSNGKGFGEKLVKKVYRS